MKQPLTFLGSISINRKFYIKEDNPEDDADYPFVRSYNEQADINYKMLKKSSLVFIDGFLKVRPFTRNTVCPYCSTPKKIPDSNLEIVPYTTEPLQNFVSLEEYQKMEEEKLNESMRNAGFY